MKIFFRIKRPLKHPRKKMWANGGLTANEKPVRSSK
jgi:hypothetical protein